VLIPRSCTALPFCAQSCVPITCRAPEFEGVASADEFAETACAANVVSEDAAVSAVTALEAEAVDTPAVVDVVSIELAAVVAAAVVTVAPFVSAVAMVSVTASEVAFVPFPQPIENTTAISKIIAVKNLKLLLCIPI
jgi:hypothetical protein